MQDQGKRLLLAVALALGVMLAWNLLFPPKKPPPTPKPVPGQTNVPAVATSMAGVALDPAVAPVPPAMAPATEAPIVLAFPGKFTATFSSEGGVLAGLHLADPRYDHNSERSSHPRGELLPALPGTGAFGVNFALSTYVLPAQQAWRGERLSDRQVRYTLTTDAIELTKTFTVIPEVYLVKMAVTAKFNIPAGRLADQTLAVSVYALQDPGKIEESKGQGLPRAWHSSTLRGETLRHTPVTSVQKAPRYEPSITWTGFEHPYLLAAYAPVVSGRSEVAKWTYADERAKGLMRTDLEFPKATVKAGDVLAHEVVAYLGPKNYKTLEAADEQAGAPTNFRSTVDLGWFAFLGKPLLWLLLKFHALFGNWGIAIILLTVLVKAATLYWTTKSMRSMKAMAALAPQMKALQEKYKDDRQRQQVETMALYKTHGVNPIAGCLPILLQMPIWLALYKMLSSAGELYFQPFITGWIDDLTTTDPYHVLPFILLVTMFGQARLTPVTGDNMQQKMLQYGMPLMFGVMAFFFPAGLTLYIFTNTILSALHSIYMNKFDKQSLAIAEKMKAAAAPQAAGGKGDGKAAAKPAKPVIDVASTEAEGDDDADDAPASAGGGGASTAARPRNPNKRNNGKKKRR